MITPVKKPETREDWLKARSKYIGGSDIAVILGVSPFKTAVQLWLEKAKGEEQSISNQEALRLGNYLEAYAADRYTEESGNAVRNYGYMLIDEDYHICGDVDRLVVPTGAKLAAYHSEIHTDTILECKTSGHAWEDEVPVFYQAQVQQYLGLTGCQYADVAVVFLSPRREYKTFRIVRDDEIISSMRIAARDWWEHHVLSGIAPDPQSEADCKAIWRASKGLPPVVASAAIAEQVAHLRDLQSQIDEIETEIDGVKTEIMSAMGDADTLVDCNNNKLCTWKSTKASTKTDWKSAYLDLAQAHGLSSDALKPYETATEGTRRFTLAKPCKA